MKRLFLIFFGILIYASNLKIETSISTLKFNYKEYQGSQVLDRESSDLSDLPGIDVTLYKNFDRFNTKLDIEYNRGETEYDGSTWGGTPLNYKEKNVYLLNSRMLIGYLLGEDRTILGNGKLYINGGIGYRLWNRGKSNYIGDYNEKYKWGYYLVGFSINEYFNNVDFDLNLYYHKAFSPKMKADLGGGVTYNLGDVEGYRFELPFRYHLNKQYGILIKYTYDYWKINKSNVKNIVISGTTIPVYEPDSKTKNQYINFGFYYNY